MWIMGVSLSISLQSQLRNSKPRSSIVINIIRRSVILFGFGLIINSIGGNNDFRTMRIPGVLQRFGIAYLIVGIIQAAIGKKEHALKKYDLFGLNTSCFWGNAGSNITPVVQFHKIFVTKNK